MSVDFNPTGTEFASGSYDQTLRIFDLNKFTSKEVYYTRRMRKFVHLFFFSFLFEFRNSEIFFFRIFSVKYSLDGHYLLTGSDDQAIRIWKADSTAPLFTPLKPLQQKLDYNKQLLERFFFFGLLFETKFLKTFFFEKKRYGEVEEVKKVLKKAKQHLPQKIFNVSKRYAEKEKGFVRRMKNNLVYSKKKEDSESLLKKIDKPKHKMKRTFIGGES